MAKRIHFFICVILTFHCMDVFAMFIRKPFTRISCVRKSSTISVTPALAGQSHRFKVPKQFLVNYRDSELVQRILDPRTVQTFNGEESCFSMQLTEPELQQAIATFPEKIEEIPADEQNRKLGFNAHMTEELRKYLKAKELDSSMVENIKSLIIQGADPNVAGDGGHTPLLFAARINSVDLTDFLLERNVDIEARTLINKNTPLTLAAGYNSLDVVRRLLQAGAYVNARTKGGNTALLSAAYYGYIDIMEELVNFGADIRAVNSQGDDAIGQALPNGYVKVKEWIEARTYRQEDNVQQTEKLKQHLLAEFAIEFPRDPLVAETIISLIDQGADPDTAAGYYAITPLKLAAIHRNFDLLNYLLKRKDVHLDTPELTALMYAASLGFVDVVTKLLQAGADMEWRNSYHGTALSLAHREGHADTVAVLIKFGADRGMVNYKPITGYKIKKSDVFFNGVSLKDYEARSYRPAR